MLAEFPAKLVHRYRVLPLGQADDALLVLTSDPFDLHALDAVSAAIGQRVTPILALPDDLSKLIKTHLGVGAETIDDLIAQSGDDQIEMLEEVQFDDSEAAEMAQQASVVRLVNEILIGSRGDRTPATFISSRRNRASRFATGSTAYCSDSRRRRR